MKKIFVVGVIACLTITTGFAQDTSVNVNSYTIPELPSVPDIDGDLSDPVWENVPTIPMEGDGDSPAAEPGAGDLDITLKIAWDEETNALYFHIDVIDDSLLLLHGLVSSGPEWDGSGWRNERLEIVIDGTNSGDPGSTTATGFHQQYTFDMPASLVPLEEGGILDLPVSTDFQSVDVYEQVNAQLNPTNYPFNVVDDYLDSAAMLRTTDSDATEWLESPAEYNWEVMLVVFEYLESSDVIGVDFDDPAAIENGFEAFFEDEFHDVNDLEEGEVIGCSVQQNDGDIFNSPVEREHQTNTTNVAGNWNSSESLTGLILGPTLSTSVVDWALQ